MALKAGRVGVNPSQVDIAGNIVGAGSGYTKAEADEKFATKTELSAKANSADVYSKTAADDLLASKVPTSQLTANSKAFYFAYDSTSEKYGYKAGSDGEFVPFEQAGGPGWVKPANLVPIPDITYNTSVSYVSGGYYVPDDEPGTAYIDMIVRLTSNKTSITYGYIMFNLPAKFRIAGNDMAAEKRDSESGMLYKSNIIGVSIATNDGSSRFVMATSSSSITVAAAYYHCWGKVSITTE